MPYRTHDPSLVKKTHRTLATRGRQAGFTLIEIMAVVVIIGFLTGLVGVAVKGSIDRAKVNTARAQMKSIETALEFYRMDNSRYPTTEQGLESLIQKPTTDPVPRDYREGGYLNAKKLPVDPWKEPYQYTGEGGSSFELHSLGADNTAGGDGTDADIYFGDFETE